MAMGTDGYGGGRSWGKIVSGFFGSLLVMGGMVLSIVPEYAPQAMGEPVFLGTLWQEGLALFALGVFVLALVVRAR